jgi:hypothetical protein
MRKLYLILLVGILMPVLAMAQAKRPTIMVIPSDIWCNQNGCMVDFDNQGVIEKTPDYKAALLNSELDQVITAFGGCMQDRDFPTKLLSQTIKNMQEDAALTQYAQLADGGTVAKTPFDKLMESARADIIININWEVKQLGPKKSIVFSIQGIDAYTGMQVASTQLTTPGVMGEISVPTMLVDCVNANIDDFNERLQSHFDDLFEKGRQVVVECLRSGDTDFDFNTTMGSDELSYIIEDAFAELTVNGVFSLDVQTPNKMTFNQVRIPMFNANGRAIDTRGWARQLVNKLRSNPDLSSIKMTVQPKGLGKVFIFFTNNF